MEVYYCAEDLVKTCNSALNKAVGSQVLTPFGGGGGVGGRVGRPCASEDVDVSHP